MSRPPRGGGSAPGSLYPGGEPPQPPTGRRSMPPDLRAPRPPAGHPDLVVRPDYRPASGGPPGGHHGGPYRPEPPYRPGSGGRGSLEDPREAPEAPREGMGGRRGGVSLSNYPRMVSRNINGTGGASIAWP